MEASAAFASCGPKGRKPHDIRGYWANWKLSALGTPMEVMVTPFGGADPADKEAAACLTKALRALQLECPRDGKVVPVRTAISSGDPRRSRFEQILDEPAADPDRDDPRSWGSALARMVRHEGAAQIHGYGHSDQIHLEDVGMPSPGPGDVLVRIFAAGVNPVDWKIREGYFAQRSAAGLPLTLGQDFAGEILWSARTWSASRRARRCTASRTARTPSTHRVTGDGRVQADHGG